jgi:peptidylprolyl isomerase
MRRTVLAVCLPLIALAACGDLKSSSTTSTAATAATVTTVATKPSVSLPSELPTELVITDLAQGSGPVAALGDLVVVNYVGVRSVDGVEFDNSYDRGSPLDVTLGGGQVIQGWEQGLIGVQQGTRRQLDIPAELAYGDQGGGEVIRPGDAISFVVDVVIVLPGSKAEDDPGIVVAPAANIDAVSSTDLIVGDGAEPAEGTSVAVRIASYRADTGEQIDSTWGTTPLTFTYGAQTNSYPGLIEAVRGMKVGGRRQVQIPFALMFDGAGSQQLGLPASIDLTVVIDLVAVY